jgi:SMI1-KNR4 cell-wall
MKQKEFWGSNYYKHPPLTDEMLDLAETKLGVKLPKTLIELLKIQNGGYTKRFVFPMTQRTTWADNHVPLSSLSGIVLDEGFRSAQNIMDTEYMTKEWGLPERQVLLTGDGHWWITLDYRDNETPCVMWIDVECNEEVKVAENFDQFIDGLVSEDTFA